MNAAALWFLLNGGYGPWVPVDLPRAFEVGAQMSDVRVPPSPPPAPVVIHRGRSGKVRGFTLGGTVQSSPPSVDAN